MVKRYLVDALGGMALGLFSTLIAGLILKQAGSLWPGTAVGRILVGLGTVASALTGAGIAVGVAHSLGAPKLVLCASLLPGLVGAHASRFLAGTLIPAAGGVLISGPGDPVGAFVAALAAAELGRLVSGRTRVDIIVTPFVSILAGAAAGLILGPPSAAGSAGLGALIRTATELQPLAMSVAISVSMGLCLTLPISSAALGIMLGLSGLAAGAATAGCCAQMIGFAAISFRDNGWNGLLAQGLGTSMLQMPNIVRNWKIWIPPTAASAVTGPLATMVFGLSNLPAGSGMGTSGLVGPLLAWQATRDSGAPAAETALAIALVCFVLPAALSLAVYAPMRGRGWIKDGQMRLPA